MKHLVSKISKQSTKPWNFLPKMSTFLNINTRYDQGRMQEVKQQELECMVQPGAQLPKRAYPSDAGADLFSYEELTIYPQEQKLVDTGIAIKIPEGYGGFIFNRSSQGKKGITIPHSVGVIDSDYRGNLKVLLKNIGEDPYNIEVGDRIAQLVIMPVLLPEFKDIWNDTQRGTGGFGSTGKN